MSKHYTLRFNPSAQRHAERIARDKGKREIDNDKPLPPERPIVRPTKPGLSVERTNELFDKYFGIHRGN